MFILAQDTLPNISPVWASILTAVSGIVTLVIVELRGRNADRHSRAGNKKKGNEDRWEGMLSSSDLVMGNLRRDLERMIDQREELQEEVHAMRYEIEQLRRENRECRRRMDEMLGLLRESGLGG